MQDDRTYYSGLGDDISDATDEQLRERAGRLAKEAASRGMFDAAVGGPENYEGLPLMGAGAAMGQNPSYRDSEAKAYTGDGSNRPRVSRGPRSLVLTVGLPYSGKTTWAQSRGIPVVSPDAVRVAIHGQRFLAVAEPFVWLICKVMVWALFLAGHTRVILDATNTTQARRREWHNPKQWELGFHVIPTSREECLLRARRADDHYIIPIIDKMSREQEPVTQDELIDLGAQFY